MKQLEVCEAQVNYVPPIEATELHGEMLRRIVKSLDRENAIKKLSAVTQALIDTTGRGLILEEENLSGLDLSDFDLRLAVLNRAVLHETNFTRANLAGAMLICPGAERTSFRQANLRGAYIHAFAAQVCDFSLSDLSEIVDGTGSLFHGCNLDGATLNNSMLAGTMFYQCSLRDAIARGGCFQGCSFVECAADRLDFSYAGLDQAVFNKTSLNHATMAGSRGEGVTFVRCSVTDRFNLSNAKLPSLRVLRSRFDQLDATAIEATDADFTNSDINSALFSKARLARARFSTTNLCGSDFSESHLDASAFRDCSASRVKFTFSQFENASFVECNLADGDFSGIRGRAMVFRDCNLTGSRFISAYLYRAVLTGDNPLAHSMKSTDFSHAVLVQAYVVGDLTGGSLRGVRAAYSRLNQCTFRDADITGASLFLSSIVKSDFTGAKLNGVAPPFFLDRCHGLSDAPQKIQAYANSFSSFMSEYRRKST